MTSIMGPNAVYAQDFKINELPQPGTMVEESMPFVPLALKGLIVNPQKPLEFQFIVDTGDGDRHPDNNYRHPERSEGSQQEQLKTQSTQLVKYFLAALTIPEGDLWVNLSPYEKNRIVPEALGQTDLGRDLLAQDYILKQLTASLIYPEKDLGKEFWSRVYTKAQQQFGTTNIPVNTFNKVWILPDQAQVFEHGAAAYVTKSTLKVMLDEDYLALKKNQRQPGDMALAVSRAPASVRQEDPSRLPSEAALNVKASQGQPAHALASQIIRQIILPEIEKEVNTGKNFAPLRQIYQALILAKWYKETIQNSLLDAVYTNKNKVAGVNLKDPTIKQQIYNRYLQAYKKGAFNYIKADPSLFPPRKYFSGGITHFGDFKLERDGAMTAVQVAGKIAVFNLVLEDAAMNAEDQVMTKASSENHGRGTLMVTSRDRLDRVNGFLTTMIKDGGVILESGLGYLPYGTVQLSNLIKNDKPRARIIGMDIHLPYFIIKNKWGGTNAIFDQNGELVGIGNAFLWKKYKDTEIFEEREMYRRYMKLKADLMAKGGHDENGNTLVVDPLQTNEFRRPNIEYRQADIFNTGLPDESVDVIRDFNLTALYYSSEDQRSAIFREYARIIKNGGHVLLGQSAKYTEAEEFLVLKKDDNHQIIEDSLIISIGKSLINLGADDYGNSSYFNTVNGLQLKNDFWVVHNTLVEKYGKTYWERALSQGAEFIFQDCVDNLNKLGYHAEIVKLPGSEREFIKLSFVNSRLKNAAMTAGIPFEQFQLNTSGNEWELKDPDGNSAKVTRSNNWVFIFEKGRWKDWVFRIPRKNLTGSERNMRENGFRLGHSLGISPSFIIGKIQGHDVIAVTYVEPVEQTRTLEDLLSRWNVDSRYVEAVKTLFRLLIQNDLDFDAEPSNIVVGYLHGKLQAWVVDAEYLGKHVHIPGSNLIREYIEDINGPEVTPWPRGRITSSVLSLLKDLALKTDEAMTVEDLPMINLNEAADELGFAYRDAKNTVIEMERDPQEGRAGRVRLVGLAVYSKKRDNFIILSATEDPRAFSEDRITHARLLPDTPFYRPGVTGDYEWVTITISYKEQGQISSITMVPMTVGNPKKSMTNLMLKYKGYEKSDLSAKRYVKNSWFETDVRDELIMIAKALQNALLRNLGDAANQLTVNIGTDEYFNRSIFTLKELASQETSFKQSAPGSSVIQQPNNPSVDKVMNSGPGGIDLNQINVKRTGKTINVQFDPAQLNALEQSDFKGFTPVITGFRYIQSPYPLLGINAPAKETEELAKA